MYLSYGDWSALIHLMAKRPSLVLALAAAIVAGNYLYAAERRNVQHEPVRSEVRTAGPTQTGSLRVDRNQIMDQQLQRISSNCGSNKSADASIRTREMYQDPGNLMVDNPKVDLSEKICGEH